MEGIREFLESSTIHGLTYISTSKAVLIKMLWIVIVSSGLVIGGLLINESFNDWKQSPVGTSEETLSIAEVVFPKFTVCPPKGTHTALNHYLEKSQNVTLNQERKEDLLNLAGKLVEERESWEIMVDSREYGETGKFRNWYKGISSVAFQFEGIQFTESIIQTLDTGKHNIDNPEFAPITRYEMSSFASSGSLQTPWFGKSYDTDTFLHALDYKFAINIPELPVEKARRTNLVLDIRLDTKESKGGREEIVLRPPGRLPVETFKNTGTMQIRKRYNVSDLISKPLFDKIHSQIAVLEKIIPEINIPEIPGISISGIPILELPLPGIPIPGITNLLDPASIAANSLNLMIQPIENLLKILFGMDKENEEDEKKNPIDNQFEIPFFRILDPTSFVLWENKRMTGFNISWHFEDENGIKIDVSGKHKKSHVSRNKFFTNWINAISQAHNKFTSEELWAHIKSLRKMYVQKHYNATLVKEKRLPKIMFLEWNLLAEANVIRLMADKLYWTERNLIKDWGDDLMIAFENNFSLQKISKYQPLLIDNMAESTLLDFSEMFIYLFSLPKTMELTLVPVWNNFYKDLFSNKPTRTILQILGNNIKKN